MLGSGILCPAKIAGVAELADAHDSKSCTFGYVGSIPTFGTEDYNQCLVEFIGWVCSVNNNSRRFPILIKNSCNRFQFLRYNYGIPARHYCLPEPKNGKYSTRQARFYRFKRVIFLLRSEGITTSTSLRSHAQDRKQNKM